jgi:hypothetical protein
LITQIIMGGVFTALDSHYSRRCPIAIAAAVAFGCCLATLAAADIVTRVVHTPIFNRCRLVLPQLLPVPKLKQ